MFICFFAVRECMCPACLIGANRHVNSVLACVMHKRAIIERIIYALERLFTD